LPERLSEIRSESFIFWSCFLICKRISFWLVKVCESLSGWSKSGVKDFDQPERDSQTLTNQKEIPLQIRKHDQKIKLSDLISESLSGN
jgi:hypothetical protein